MTELAETQPDVSQTDEPDLMTAETSIKLIPIPNAVIMFDPVDITLCLMLEIEGKLNVKKRGESTEDACRETVTNTGEELRQPEETLAAKELHEIHELASAEVLASDIFNDDLNLLKSRAVKVTKSAPEAGELCAIDKRYGKLKLNKRVDDPD